MKKLILRVRGRPPDKVFFGLDLSLNTHGLYTGVDCVSQEEGVCVFFAEPNQVSVLVLLQNLERMLEETGRPDIPLLLFGNAPPWVYASIASFAVYKYGHHVYYRTSTDDRPIILHRPGLIAGHNTRSTEDVIA